LRPHVLFSAGFFALQVGRSHTELQEVQTMQIGKYTVTAYAGERKEGGFQGYVYLRWDEGDTTKEMPLYLDGVFNSPEEAKASALDQVRLRVARGVL
jgi:hypothetical protein